MRVIGTDGTSLELVCSNKLPDLEKGQSASQAHECEQIGITKDDPGDPEYYEALVMDIPFQTFADFGNSKSLRVQVGSASFEVPAETVSAFHYFAEVMKAQ